MTTGMAGFFDIFKTGRKIGNVYAQFFPEGGPIVEPGYIAMRAYSEDGSWYSEIFPANTPSTIRLYEAFRSGEYLTLERDADKADKAAQREKPIGPFQIVDMRVEPNEEGVDVLKVTLQSGPLPATATFWPPRTPSAKSLLEAFDQGQELYDSDLRILMKLMHKEVKTKKSSVLDWDPDWITYR